MPPLTSRACPEASPLWTKRLGDGLDQLAADLVAHGDGTLTVAGYFKGTIDFGNTTLESAGEADVFVAKLDPEGNCIWARRFGGEGADGVGEMGVDAEDDVSLFGWSLTPDGNASAVFLVKRDPSGSLVWSESFATPYWSGGHRLAVGPMGDILIAMSTYGPVDFGGGAVGPVATYGGSMGLVAARFDFAGQHLWSDRLDAPKSSPTLGGLTFDAGNHWYASCYHCVEPDQPVLMRCGTSNEITWTQPMSVRFDTMSVGANGGIVGTGGFIGDVELAGQVLKNHGVVWSDGPYGLDAFVAGLESDGTPRWGVGFGGADDDIGRDLVLDGEGNAIVSGELDFSSSSYGGEPIPGRAFVAAFDSAGNEFWRGALSGVYYSSAAGVAVDGDGDVFIAGYVFTVYDVAADERARRVRDRLNARHSVPTIDVDGVTLVGFSEARLERTLRERARRRLGL